MTLLSELLTAWREYEKTCRDMQVVAIFEAREAQKDNDIWDSLGIPNPNIRPGKVEISFEGFMSWLAQREEEK